MSAVENFRSKGRLVMPFRWTLTLCMGIVLAGTALAQTGTGIVVGAVTDSSGALIPNAKVVLVNKATNVSDNTVTSDAGIFRFPVVAVGEYRLTVEAGGFEKASVEAVRVAVGETARAELQLRIAGQEQSVTVQATVATIQSESAAVATAVTHQEVDNLPLNGRNLIQLEALQPNAVPFPRTSVVSNRGGYNVLAGTPVEATGMTIDGINIKETSDPRATILLSPDVTEEFQSASSNYSAAQGQAGGAQVNVVTRAGTNTFHGSVYEFFRNDKLNARNFFDAQKPPYRQNQFGGSFGGPIKRDRLFFYSGYEGSRIVQSRSQRFTVPTLAERQGDFTGEAQIYDPLTYDSATGKKQPFSNNAIPAPMIAQESLKALQLLYPAPNLPGRTNNLIGAKPDTQVADQFLVRGDYRASDSDTFFARYIYFDPRKVTGGFANLPNFADIQNTPAHNTALGYTRVLSPTVVNQFRVGFYRFTQILQDRQLGVPINQQIGITGTSTQFLGNPAISIAGYSGPTGAVSNAPNNRADTSYYIYDDLLLTKGAHGLSMGFNATRDDVNGGLNTNARGAFTFNNNYTALAMADFMMGYPSTSARGLGSGFRNLRQHKLGAYFQDDWKLSQSFTLNLGVRYEYFQPAYEVHNNLSAFDPATASIVQVGTAGIPAGVRGASVLGFQPRVGLAWRPWNSKKTVIRSGYSINRMPLGVHPVPFTMVTNPPMFISESYFGNPNVPNLTLRNAFPSGLGVPSTTLTTLSKDFVDPYVQQWNVAVEREMGKRVTFEIDYVGNKGTHLRNSQNINAPYAGPGTLQAKRPYPAFSTITSWNSMSASTYESVAFKAQRRFTQSLTFLSSYTFAKLLSTGGIQHPGDLGTAPVRDPLNPGAEKGRDYFDIRQRFVSSFVYKLPVGRGHALGGSWARWADQILGQWQINGILTLQSGYPLTPVLAVDNSNTGLLGDRPDVTRNPNDGPGTVQQWFDTGAFAMPAKYSYGNSGKDIIEGPATKQLDFSLFKRWGWGEGRDLTFRAEVFNLTNTAQFNQPGATYNTAAFGVISSAGDPRLIQFGLKLAF